MMQGRDRVTVGDVADVYRNALLGPSGQNDLVHYETRLKDGLEDESYSIAMEILAEAATRDVFTPGARRSLEWLYANVVGGCTGTYRGSARRPRARRLHRGRPRRSSLCVAVAEGLVVGAVPRPSRTA